MTYRNLMVRLQLNGDNRGVLQIAAELAERFSANVIGIAACQPIQFIANEGFHTPEVIMQDREEIIRELRAAETEFRNALSGCAGRLEWRSAIIHSPLADYIAQEARSADLIITVKDQGLGLLEENRKVDLGDLAMRAGRPILVVPNGIASLPLRHVFVGWKDTREARRAVVDALPLLKAAGQGTVLEIAPEHQHAAAQARLDDVSRWLKRHDVVMTCRTVSASGTEASFLHAFLLDHHCDLLVAGAYGHSRLKEWVFGGVTQDMLLDPPFCVLLAH
jgi:nucleotide-binding universal stress UspA family protein